MFRRVSSNNVDKREPARPGSPGVRRNRTPSTAVRCAWRPGSRLCPEAHGVRTHAERRVVARDRPDVSARPAMPIAIYGSKPSRGRNHAASRRTASAPSGAKSAMVCQMWIASSVTSAVRRRPRKGPNSTRTTPLCRRGRSSTGATHRGGCQPSAVTSRHHSDRQVTAGRTTRPVHASPAQDLRRRERRTNGSVASQRAGRDLRSTRGMAGGLPCRHRGGAPNAQSTTDIRGE
jgi:hypothetical protein